MKPPILHKASDAKRLTQLARAINDRQAVIEEFGSKLQTVACSAMGEVLLQGQDLLTVKSILPHGQWETWLETHCPKAVRTAQKYMQLANKMASGDISKASRAALLEAPSIRQALEILRCFDQSAIGCTAGEAGGSPGTARAWPAYLEAINRFSKVVKFCTVHRVEDFPKEGQEKLREQLLPVVQVLWPDLFE